MAGELADLRRKLDEVDDRIIEALAQRQQFVNEVAQQKAANAGGPARHAAASRTA